jgi:hypothetical protein
MLQWRGGRLGERDSKRCADLVALTLQLVVAGHGIDVLAQQMTRKQRQWGSWGAVCVVHLMLAKLSIK